MRRPTTYPGIDLIRFAAALMVLFYHLGFWLWRDDPTRQMPRLERLVSSGWVGVPIFFVISGFVIAFSARDRTAAEFVRSRAGRLYPAAWICGTASFILSPNTVGNYVRTMLLLPVGPWVVGLYWTLAIEISFYALVAVALWRGWSIRKLALCLGGYSTAFWILKAANLALGNRVDFNVIENYTGYLLLAHDGIFFAFGILLYKRAHLIPAIVFAATGFVAIAWRSHAMEFGAIPFYVAPVIWLIATLAIVVLVLDNRHVSGALNGLPIRTIGLMTYPLYLIHVDLGRAVMLAFDDQAIAFPAAVAAAVGAAFLVLPIEARLRLMFTKRASPEMATLP